MDTLNLFEESITLYTSRVIEQICREYGLDFLELSNRYIPHCTKQCEILKPKKICNSKGSCTSVVVPGYLLCETHLKKLRGLK